MVKKSSSLLLLATIILLHGCASDNTKRVHAQMFLKVPLEQEGAIECFAEGKYYGILPVREQTFLPGDDSFHKMHHHGVAIESEVMAYRIYFDKRQTIDVYAKKTPRLELAESLWYPNDEQLARGFGDDVLKVGSTIGVGSVRPWSREKQKLENMDKFEKRTQRIVSQSEDAATAEVEVRGLQTEEGTTDMLTRYTIKAGHRDMLCQVYMSDYIGNLVTGVQKIGDGKSMVQEGKSTLLASWGTDWPVNDTVKYGKETVGIAVAVQEEYAGETVKAERQTLVYLTPRQNDKTGMPEGYKYYAEFRLTTVAMKENTPPAKSAEEFYEYVKVWSEKL